MQMVGALFIGVGISSLIGTFIIARLFSRQVVVVTMVQGPGLCGHACGRSLHWLG
jgi:hypothetical protein